MRGSASSCGARSIWAWSSAVSGNLRSLGSAGPIGLSIPLLRTTREAITGWKSLTPERSRVPLSCFRPAVVVLTCLAAGAQWHGYQWRVWWSVALALWSGFVCLLQPGELLNLWRQDVCFPEEEGGESHSLGAVVIVRKPKNRRIWRQQFVLCRDPRLVRWSITMVGSRCPRQDRAL